MRYSVALPLALVASWTTCNHAFINIFGVRVQAKFKITASYPYRASSSLALSSEPDIDPQDSPRRPVEKDTFVGAVETLKREIARANGIDVDMTASEKPEETREIGYLIGKLVVSLPIDTPAGLDLTESTGLVLVSAVSEKTAAETGMQPFDTIVGVSVSPAGKGTTFQESTKALGFEETIAIVQSARLHALENGMTKIELELNRLIKGYYGA